MRNRRAARAVARWVGPIVAGMLLAACAAPVEYVAPAGAERARLTLVAHSYTNVSFTSEDDRHCPELKRTRLAAFEADNLMQIKTLASTADIERRSAEIPIEAGGPFGLSGRIGACQVGMVFVPVAGEHYEAHFDLVGPYCRLKIQHVTTTPGGDVHRALLPDAHQVDRFCPTH